MLALLVYANAASGKKEEATRILGQMNDLAKRRYVSTYNFAVAYAALGDMDQAFQWLELSLPDRAWEITCLKVDPLRDSLRTDPRFGDLVKRIGL